MKTLKFTLCLLTALATTAGVHAETWACGPRDDADGSFHASVMATLEVNPITNDSILRIYRNKDIVIPGESIAVAEFNVTEQEPTGKITKTDAPWDNIAANIDEVIVENGVQRIGKYAFYTITNLKSISLPNSVDAVEDDFLSEDFGYSIMPVAENVYINISREYPPYSENEYKNYQTRSNVILRVPNDNALTRYKSADYGAWWNLFTNIEVSLEAAAVVSVPQDSITATKATIQVEYLEDATKYALKLTNLSTMAVANYEVTFDDKGDPMITKLAPSNGAPARRKPVLLRDTVRRSTESLQIDITDLAPETPYAYSVEAVNVSSTVIMSKEGTFKTAPLDLDTAFDEFTNEEMRKGKNVKILRDGHIFIIRDGEWLDITGHRVK